MKDGLPWWLSWQRIRLQCRRPGFYPWVGKRGRQGVCGVRHPPEADTEARSPGGTPCGVRTCRQGPLGDESLLGRSPDMPTAAKVTAGHRAARPVQLTAQKDTAFQHRQPLGAVARVSQGGSQTLGRRSWKRLKGAQESGRNQAGGRPGPGRQSPSLLISVLVQRTPELPTEQLPRLRFPRPFFAVQFSHLVMSDSL